MSDNIKIIGFSGKIGVGKNYIAEQIFGKKLYDMGYNVHILAFADQTKYELGSRFSLIDKSCNFLEELNETFDELFVNKSTNTRRKLQIYATEHCRNGGNWNIKDEFFMYNEPCIWIKGLYLQIKNIILKSYDKKKDIFVITDVRFKNEAQFIQSLGGCIVRIVSPTRNNLKLSEEAKRKNIEGANIDIDTLIEEMKNHESETNLDDCEFRYTIDNDDSVSNVVEQVDCVINDFLEKI